MKCYTDRPYQTEAVKSAYADWAFGLHRILVSLPTGMGKTVVATNITRREVQQGRRVAMLVNRDELVRQTVDTMTQILPPGTVIGVVQGKRHETSAQVLVISIQTLGTSPLKRADIGTLDMIIIDECHHGSAPTYIDTVRDLGGFDGVRVLGMTATATRNDALGMGDVWQKVTYRQTVEYAFENGYLIRPFIDPVFRRGVNLDPEHLARVWAEKARDQTGMVAVDTVKKAHAVASAFNRNGIPAVVIHGGMPTAKREAAYAATVARTNRVLISVSCLTEGFDLPSLTILMVARTIGSQTVWAQLVGRIVRPAAGKHFAAVMDMAGSSQKFCSRDNPEGLTVVPNLSKTVKGKREERPVEGVMFRGVHTYRFGYPITHVYRLEGTQKIRIGTVLWGTEKRRTRTATRIIRRQQANESGVPQAFRSVRSWATSGFN